MSKYQLVQANTEAAVEERNKRIKLAKLQLLNSLSLILDNPATAMYMHYLWHTTQIFVIHGPGEKDDYLNGVMSVGTQIYADAMLTNPQHVADFATKFKEDLLSNVG